MSDPNDRLYELLPAVHRLRDRERGYPLRDLLRVIAEQVDIVEDNITQMYDDWFIETASDWAVPYIADLVGYSPVLAAGDPATSRAAENRVLVPRREVANTVAYRRRRGTLSVLEDLSRAVGAWPARAIEFYRLLCWAQHLNHQHADGARARTVSLRDANALDQIGTAFDPFAHTVDVRRISSRRSQGRYNIPSVAVVVWRLQPYVVTKTPAYCLDAGKNNYTFSVLGNDAPLFTQPEPEPAATGIAGEINVPTPIRRRAFDADKDAFYGDGKSIALWAEWAGHPASAPIPSAAILPADLSDWHYAPPDNFVAVDPRLGRITFPVNQMPRKHVRVSYALRLQRRDGWRRVRTHSLATRVLHRLHRRRAGRLQEGLGRARRLAGGGSAAGGCRDRNYRQRGIRGADQRVAGGRPVAADSRRETSRVPSSACWTGRRICRMR